MRYPILMQGKRAAPQSSTDQGAKANNTAALQERFFLFLHGKMKRVLSMPVYPIKMSCCAHLFPYRKQV